MFVSLSICVLIMFYRNAPVISPDAASILFAAADGDLDELVRLKARGMDLFACNYDLRSALHLACSNGKVDAGQVSTPCHSPV